MDLILKQESESNSTPELVTEPFPMSLEQVLLKCWEGGRERRGKRKGKAGREGRKGEKERRNEGKRNLHWDLWGQDKVTTTFSEPGE